MFMAVLLMSLQCSNESVFAADFHPTDANVVVTCGKSHLCFWSLEKGSLVKKQGLFEVRLLVFLFISADVSFVVLQTLKCMLLSVAFLPKKNKAVFMFLAETREAQVCIVCDFFRKWRRHHRRFKWKYTSMGKR